MTTTEPELRALAARDATDNPLGKMLERIAEAQAERDAARADLAALQQVIDQQAGLIDAEREKVRVLREAADRIANGKGDSITGHLPAAECRRVAAAALATTEPKPERKADE